MKKRRISRNDNAVSGVVEALLLVALVAMILATIQLVYIPPIMEDKENAHMDEVEKQFSYLKSTIDIQSMTKEKILMSSPITLGSKELPYFVTMGATGQINLLDENDVGDCKLKVLPAPTFNPLKTEFDNGIPLTSIKYGASNSYIEDYNYILEGGGLIDQTPSENMIVKPSIIVENNTNDIVIHYNLPFFTSVPGKKSDVCGYGNADKTVFIRTNYSTFYTSSSNDITKLQIFTNYPDAWNESLIGDNGLLTEYYQNGYINVVRYDSQNPPLIEILPASKNIDLEIDVVQIRVQIGAGIVK